MSSPHQEEQQQENEAAQRKAGRRGESVEKAHVSPPLHQTSLIPPKHLPHCPSHLTTTSHRPSNTITAAQIPHLCDEIWLFPSVGFFFFSNPQTRLLLLFLTVFVVLLLLGGGVAHLSAGCEPQRHVQAEREGNHSQRLRRCSSQSPAR